MMAVTSALTRRVICVFAAGRALRWSSAAMRWERKRGVEERGEVRKAGERSSVSRWDSERYVGSVNTAESGDSSDAGSTR